MPNTSIFRIIMALALALALTSGPLAASEHEEPEQVHRVYIDYVKPGQRMEFRQLTLEWNECLKEGGVEQGWSVWESRTGEGLRFAFVIGPVGWAYFDREPGIEMACFEQFGARYAATIDKGSSHIRVLQPHASHHLDMQSSVVAVTNFRVRNERAFMKNWVKITEAARAAEWPFPHYLFASIGSRGSANFYVSGGRSSFADFDNDGFWAMVEAHWGEEEMERMMAENREAIVETWTDIWQRDDELSFQPD